VAEPHLDHPGEIRWFKGERALPVLGPCPHTDCKHLGQGVIAWGPTLDRYELVECGSLNVPPATDDCGTTCRAWVDGRGRVTTPWLHVDMSVTATVPP
jgi:hypothetical protein